MSDLITILNGPNLNLLGQREPEIYGSQTLDDIKTLCETKAGSMGLDLFFAQSNQEGELIDWIHEARISSKGLIINPAAYTHTSVALHDALLTLEIPIIEVHLSNIHKRENFRHHSYVSPVAEGIIVGFGAKGYLMALDFFTK